MDTVGVSLVGGAVANQGGDLDEGWLVCHLLGLLDGITQAVQVCVAILHTHTHTHTCSASTGGQARV